MASKFLEVALDNSFSFSSLEIIKAQVHKMAKTKEHDVCQPFVTNHLTTIKLQLDQTHTELLVQSQSCPSTLSTALETVDCSLKDFVQLQQKHLSTKMSSQLKRYKAIIYEKDLLRTWSLDPCLAEHVNFKLESICLYSLCVFFI